MSDGNQVDLITTLVTRLLQIAEEARGELRPHYEGLFEELQRWMDEAELLWDEDAGGEVEENSDGQASSAEVCDMFC